MTIKNRLEKLEEKTNLTNEYCQCFPMVRTEFYEQYASDTEPKLISGAVPDICPKCSRAAEKQVIILNFS